MGTKIQKKIGKDPGLELKVSFVVFPSVPKSTQGPQARQSEATNHAKNAKVRFQQCQETAIPKQRALIGGRRQRA